MGSSLREALLPSRAFRRQPPGVMGIWQLRSHRAGVDRVRQDVVHQGWRPGMAAGAWDIGTGVQALEDLADGRPLVDEPAIKGAHQRGLFLVHDKVAWHRLLARHVAITVRRTAALVVAVARLLQLATAEALAENGPLVFGDGALDLQQELVIRVVRDRVLQEHDLNACAAELFQEQDLVGVFAGEAIGGQHGDDSDGTVAHGVPERVEAGPVEPAAAVALVAEDEVVADLVPSRSRPVAQSGELAVDGLEALLALG